MKKKMMNERLLAMPEALRVKLHKYFVNGGGSSNAFYEVGGTRKEINAVVEWWNRYGMIVPDDAAVQS